MANNNGSTSDRAPLSVMLFHSAMSKGQSISELADDLHIGAISLRQFVLGKTQRPRQKTLEQIGEALNMSVDEVRRRMELLPEAAPDFGEWLQHQMDSKGKVSRAKLTRDTKISDGALRNYLSGQTLPDSDQAQRLADALGVQSMEMARVIVANQVSDNGGATVPALAEDEASDAQGDAGEISAAASEEDAQSVAASAPAAQAGGATSHDEQYLTGLWRQLHPQGRRATLGYIAMLLAER